MGGGVYSTISATTTRKQQNYHQKSNAEIFTQKTVINEMCPKNISIRESRDSNEHPNSLAIVLGLDVTASMGGLPQLLIRDGLPKIMGNIIENGEPDPQVLFLGIGDHECDRSPLQVGQFESSDSKLDHWLTSTYLEGGGGGNSGESYLLAWHFAAMNTVTDCFEKRGRKGLLITIGDEPTLRHINQYHLKDIMGKGQFGDTSAIELLALAQKSYDVHHIHTLSTPTGVRYRDDPFWRELLGNNLHQVDSTNEITDAIINIVKNHNEMSEVPLNKEAPSTTSNEEVL